MYPNLEAEMARKSVKAVQLSNAIGVNESTFSGKRNGKTDFSLREAVEIKRILKADIPLEELFKKGD